MRADRHLLLIRPEPLLLTLLARHIRPQDVHYQWWTLINTLYGASEQPGRTLTVFEADGETLRHCAEAKDKPFTRADVDHAAGKVADAGHSGLIFVYGPNAKAGMDLQTVVAEYEAKGFDLTFVAAPAFAEGIVSLAPSVTWAETVELINKHLALTRSKEVTIQHCKEVIEKVTK